MRERQWGRFLMVAAMMFAVAACADDRADDGVYGDTTAMGRTAGGDVAATSMSSPAAVTAFLSTVNQGEIQAGELAGDKATNAQVRQYAQMIVTDHTRLQEELHTEARADSMAAGHVVADLHAKHEQLMTTLRNTAKGRGFDSAYVAAMVTGHQDALRQLDQMRSGVGSATTGTSTDTGMRSGTAYGTQRQDTGRPGTTQPAGTTAHGNLQATIESARQVIQRHLERGQELQRTLTGSNGR
jgi:putative membrane protein